MLHLPTFSREGCADASSDAKRARRDFSNRSRPPIEKSTVRVKGMASSSTRDWTMSECADVCTAVRPCRTCETREGREM